MDKTLQTPPELVPTTTDDQNTPPLPTKTTFTNLKLLPSAILARTARLTALRYTSPTDQMMSPATRGILARSRKGSKLFPPSANHPPKIQALQLQELSPAQIEKCPN
ncbi:UNVERIFIED_CONTAM: hypothetical protein Slati_1603100 [Sesamum latifolium]|uniref:Uncharacterized protein n=1 Tax=Sesamum latifolium TaxID=2727402 RepID=A0AAW2XCE4_9LAMI